MFGRKKLSFVIPVIFFFFFFLFFLASSASFGKSLPPKDQQFKNENLASLKLWGPDYDEKEAEKWREFIRIAAENEDLEIANKFLVLKETFHGDLPGQYPLALFELYKRTPSFSYRLFTNILKVISEPFCRAGSIMQKMFNMKKLKNTAEMHPVLKRSKFF